ncbi:FAD/NAD(P)-binding protein [Echinicola vietnamensis]|uniref:FAD-dependent urate hydroxylase HpyO/Asp monooxygenase CreE-like FAD/NAD(P)-binding domain-containing protein n=1 Tax=Echinicola vietnamensis (strain DSM 17526 / LMG 23754 / KMM 6221) TaxID=926556 RepID=L0FVE6_ECHVK|nr:FAD/NAD(P)-binding protein [Echinicola vietnamensis]AGA77282.1 hypothetical protein Echvi_1011 [Echinicola vietnamensis DSM 17526]
MKNITIIGGGANGISAFIELFIHIVTSGLEKEVQVTIVEKDERLGYGLAFGTPQPGHILNTQADLMGIFAHEPGHFAAWLKKKGHRQREDLKGTDEVDNAYTTRIFYGDYIAEQADRYLKMARSRGFVVEVVKGYAVDMEMDAGSYRVMLENGEAIPSDFVILALGTPKPNNFSKFQKRPEYVDFPWPTSRLKSTIPGDAHVGVLGTSLSAIDTVMTLVDNDHRGKISLFSPDGLLPRVQPLENKTYQRIYLTLHNIHSIKRKTLQKPRVKTLLRLFMEEVAHYEGHPVDWRQFTARLSSPEALLAWDISCAEEGGDALLNIADALRYDASTIWSWMDTDQKLLFKKWVGSDWAINRHPMPLHNAKKLRKLFDQGQLEVCAMKDGDAVSYQQGTFGIKTSQKERVTVDFLVNATGSSSALAQMESPLIHKLLERNYIQPYEVGGAVLNERTMQVISPKGGEGIYAVGHIANGILMDVNAVWYNVKTIGTLARDIIFRLAEEG